MVRVRAADDVGAVEEVADVVAAHDGQLVARGLDEVALVLAPPALLRDQLGLLLGIDAVGAGDAWKQHERDDEEAPHERGPGMKSDSPNRPTRLLVTRSTAIASW